MYCPMAFSLLATMFMSAAIAAPQRDHRGLLTIETGNALPVWNDFAKPPVAVLSNATEAAASLSGELVCRIATSPCDEHVFVLGGVSKTGKRRLLVSLFKPDGWTVLSVKAAGVPAQGRVRVTTLDSFTEPPRVTEIDYSDSKIDFGRTLTSSVRLIEW